MAKHSSIILKSAILFLLLLLLQQLKQIQSTYLMPPTQQMQSHQQQQSASNTYNHQNRDQSSVQQLLQPIISPFSFNQNVQENQRASVMCTTASGETKGITFSWLKDGQLVTGPVASARRIQVKPDTDSSTLKINSVRLEHAGNYTCVAKNDYGTHLHSAQLVVMAEPRWLKEPHAEPIVATRGQTVVIDCQTTGWPRPQQSWLFKPHTPGSEFEPLAGLVGGGGRVSLAANGSLVIRHADKSDEANYLCKSSNGIGKGISWSTSLKVTVPAHFEPAAKQQQQQTVTRRSNQVQLRCDAYGDQPITIEWFKNKQPLAQHQEGALVPGDVRYSIHVNNNPLKNGLISQLLIKQAQRSDNSLYECVTRNPYGRDRLAIELVIQEEPDNIQELQLTKVSSRSVTLAWSEPYDGRAAIASYMFQYKRVASSVEAPINELAEFEDSEQILGVGQQAQQPVGGSHFRMAAASALDSDWQHASRLVLPMQADSSQTSGVKSVTIEKLEPSSKYVLRALAVNAIGQSKFSQPMEFNTDEEAPEVGPVNIRAEAINSTSIQVSWDDIPRSKHLGRIQGYYIGYRVFNNNSAASNFIYKTYIIGEFVPTAAALQQSAPSAAPQTGSNVDQQLPAPGQSRLGTAIHDLRRDTVYEITVVAFNSRGSGPTSDFVVCKTIEMEAPKPVKLTIRRESNESIFIEWRRDPTDQNPVDDYVLYQEKNSASQEWLQVRLPGNQTQYKAPGLKCGTRYQFYIIAHNKVGKSAPSEVASASTSGALPVIPSKTSLIKITNSTCLLVNLNSFQDNGCRIKTFTVRYRVDKQNVAESLAVQQQASGATGSSQMIGANGISPSQQALTAASQLGGKTVLAGQTANSVSQHASEWTTIRPKSNIKQQRANEEDRMEYLCDLSPTGEYTIHVAANNDVGRSEIEYTVLMSSDELRYSFLREMMESLGNLFAFVPSMLVFLLAGLLLSIVSLILYTTAMKYYQKFVIMQNQMRATRRAKSDEKRRRKLANAMNQSRQSQKMAELWVEDYDEEGGFEDEDGEMEEVDESGVLTSGTNCVDVDGDDEDDGTATTDELRSTSSSSNNSNAAIHRRPSAAYKQRQRVTGRALARGHSHLSHATLRPHQYLNQQHRHHHHHQHSRSHLAQHPQQSHYLSNISNSAFDTSSVDSPCNKQAGSTCMSSASTDSILNSRFRCLNSKQYVKMNEYTMLPTISGSLGAAKAAADNDIYGIRRPQHSSPAHHYRLNGTSPSGNSSSSASNITASTNATNGTANNASSLYYSTLRRTNMQTYLPQQRTQPQMNRDSSQAQQQNMADIYGYYMAPQLQQQQQQQAQTSVQQASASQVRAQAQQAQVAAAAAAAAAAAQQAANEAANSIFVPPQQIIYSAPNIRRQPPVFL